MNRSSFSRRSFLKWAEMVGLALGLPSAAAFGAASQGVKPAAPADASSPKKLDSPDTILLKDYRPKSIYKIDRKSVV